MNTKRKKYEKGGGFAFLGNCLSRYVVLNMFVFAVIVVENEINYNYTVVQKAVQNGAITENWKNYLVLAFWTTAVGILGTIIKIFADMWTEKVTKFAFFKRYQFVIQSQKEACMLQYSVATAKLQAITGVILAIVNSVYTIKMMDIVKMTFPQYVGAALILILGIGLGIWRGKLQKKSDTIRNAVNAKEQTLIHHPVVSTNVLENHLVKIRSMYSKIIRVQLLKNSICELPKLIRVSIFLMLMYNIVEQMGKSEVYSYSYVVWNVYGYILELALKIGSVVEAVSKIYAYTREKKLIYLNSFEENENKIISREAKNTTLENDEFSICKVFSANVSRADGIEAYYRLAYDLRLKKGQIAVLEGQNGTGKTRFLNLLKQIHIDSCISYTPKTTIMPDYASNFREDSEMEYELIKRLSDGLGLKRIPRNIEEFSRMKLEKEVNGADQQLLTALQILYWAHKAKSPQLVILDELFGNISPENAPRVIAFISQELRKVGACTIIVTHCHKQVVHEYVDQVWQMTNDGEYICIKQI